MQETTEYSVHNPIVQLFMEGAFFNSALGCASRDWYLLGRRTIPMPSRHKGTPLPFTNMLFLSDAATGVYLGYEMMPHGAPCAKRLIDALRAAIDAHGRPRKGIALNPTMWSSFRIIQTSSLAEFVDIPSYAAFGSDFEAMSLSDRLEVERWILGAGLACSFSPYAIRGDPVVCAFETPILEYPHSAN